MASPSAKQTNMQRPAPNSPSPRGGLQRIPPQDLDAEMALLGSMMMSRDAIAEVVPVISRSTSHWLYRPDHQKLFEVLLDRRRRLYVLCVTFHDDGPFVGTSHDEQVVVVF